MFECASVIMKEEQWVNLYSGGGADFPNSVYQRPDIISLIEPPNKYRTSFGEEGSGVEPLDYREYFRPSLYYGCWGGWQ